MPIRVLPPRVAARIAAGEVVERPASVVKELVENALDAGATRIAVEVTAGGIDSIRVSDDGCGIEREELEMAFDRHATSKLEEGEDLSRILTLGFRGEALPSIAAVAEVEMVSRPPQQEAAAYLRLVPESPSERGARGAPPGTSITVRRLFARQPARRKFLRTPASEGNAVVSVVSHYALAYPEVRLSLSLDGRQTLLTTGSGYLRDAFSAVYGTEVAAAMLEIRKKEQGTLRQGSGQARNTAPPFTRPDRAAGGEGSAILVDGLVAPPHLSRAGRGYISLFVNRRWVQSRRLAFAVEEAYGGMLMAGRHPIAALNLRLPYEEVDVNVHPAKAEVRFRDESAVFGAIQKAVRGALLEAAPVPSASLAALGLGLSAQPSAPPLWEHALALERRSETEVRPPTPDPRASTPLSALPVLRVIGQFGAIYIVAEGPDGMYLIDQHAAHERVLYERFLSQRQKHSPEVQGLLEPLTLELAPRHVALLGREEPALREHGFEIEPFGPSTGLRTGGGAYLLRALPRTLASGGDLPQAMLSFLDLMLEEGESASGGSGQDRVAMSLACHGAVRAGKTLTLEEMRELVRQLEECETPGTCPHGRPTMLHMSAELMAREFGRR